MPADELHVWQVKLNESPVEFQIQCLDQEELHRAERFINEAHRRRYLLAHFFLRSILARYLAIPAAKIVFFKQANGKPYIQSQANLQFNMSHSEDMALYAITQGREIGIDIEKINEQIDVLAIAARFFAADEYQSLKILPAEEQALKFYEIWSGKEAYIKATGAGLTRSLSQFSALNNSSIRILEINPEYKAALALAKPEPWPLLKMYSQ